MRRPALISVVQEAYVQGVSTRMMEKLARSLGIESLSAGQVSEMTKDLNEQVEQFRNRDLSDYEYPILWVDALYEKIRQGGRVVSMAVLVVCGVNNEGMREILAVELMMEESKETYHQLFSALKARELARVQLVVSDAHGGLREAIKQSFPAASWHDARYTLCVIFWLTFLTKRRRLLLLTSSKFGWLLLKKLPDREPNS